MKADRPNGTHRSARVLAVLVGLMGLIGIAGCDSGSAEDDRGVSIGSKNFTESVVLGEALVQLARDAGAEGEHRAALGGSRVLFEALQVGAIDAYVEYTGTLRFELLAGDGPLAYEELEHELGELGLAMSRPIGFNNTYAIGMLEERAAELGVTRVSDLAAHPELRFAFSNEFMSRGDGWPGLRARYGLEQEARGMDHTLAYRALAAGGIDAMELYSTDAEIDFFGLRVLEDDLAYFPRYEAIVLYRSDLGERLPGVLESILRLEGALDEGAMSGLNRLAKIGETPRDGGEAVRVPEAVVAQRFVSERFAIEQGVVLETWQDRLVRTTRQHLVLVGISLGLAVLIAVPLGVFAWWHKPTGTAVLAAVGIVQTIPSLALLVLLIPVFGDVGAGPAITALFCYSLLPIVRNTHAGLSAIPVELRESAAALGFGTLDRLVRLELPLASRVILAGIKTAAVINIGTATLAALIGAGGYGEPIVTGISLLDNGLIMQGAIPAALLALVAQGLFGLCERALPRGLGA